MDVRSVRRLRRVLGRALLGLTVLLVAIAGYLCIRPIPQPILRWLVIQSAPSLLTDHALAPPGRLNWATRVSARAWGNLLSFSLARAYTDAVPVDPAADDVSYLMARLSPLRRSLVSQNELVHPAHDWFGFFSGLGYCDQLNRVGALVLTERFRRVQTFALSSPDRSGGHVVGRVWSDGIGDWIYFDLWPVNVALFRFDGGVKPLGAACDVARGNAPPRDALAAELYPQVPFGSVLNEYPSTFGAYLWSRLGVDHAIGASVAADYASLRAASAAVRPSAVAPSVVTPTGVSRPSAGWAPAVSSSGAALTVTPDVARVFMRERLERLLAPGDRVPHVPSAPTPSEDDRLLISVSRLVAGKLTTPPASCSANASSEGNAASTLTRAGG